MIMILIKLYPMHQKNLRRRNNLVGFRQTLIIIHILQIIFAYAIMSSDKKKLCNHNETKPRKCARLSGFLFLFFVVGRLKPTG